MELETLSPELARELGLRDPKSKGVVVSGLEYEGPAAVAGLSRGDLIVEVDRKPTPDVEAFFAVVKEKKSYLLRVRRGDGQGRDLYSVFVLDLKDR
jgi:S1-C subfamily serine protease